MNELITITEKKGTQLVDARELHRKLESKKHFADWIKRRIEKYDFIENEDYFIFSPIGEKIERGRPSLEYHITITMAKELAMLQDNKQGKKIRRYFIEMEKIARKQILSIPAPKIYNGVKCIHYTSWLIQNGYSLMSGQVRARIKKYPEQFRKGKNGWYMSEAIANYYIGYKNRDEQVQSLPSINPQQLILEFEVK